MILLCKIVTYIDKERQTLLTQCQGHIMISKKQYIIILISALVVVWLSMFVTDFISASTLREPKFVLPIDTADDGGSGTYLGLGYTVELEARLDVDLGVVIEKTEMKVFGRVIASSERERESIRY